MISTTMRRHWTSSIMKSASKKFSQKLSDDTLQLESAFKQILYFLDYLYFKAKLHAYLHKFTDNISALHNNKLQIQQLNFRFDNVIFNFSSYYSYYFFYAFFLVFRASNLIFHKSSYHLYN